MFSRNSSSHHLMYANQRTNSITEEIAVIIGMKRHLHLKQFEVYYGCFQKTKYYFAKIQFDPKNLFTTNPTARQTTPCKNGKILNKSLKTPSVVFHIAETEFLKIMKDIILSTYYANIRLTVERKYLHTLSSVKEHHITQLIGDNFKIKVFQENNLQEIQTKIDLKKKTKAKCVSKKNSSLKTRRHQNVHGISNLPLVKLVQCSTLELLYKTFYFKMSIDNMTPTPLQSFEIRQKMRMSFHNNILNRFSNSSPLMLLRRKKRMLKHRKQMIDWKISRQSQTLVCQFPYRFKCYIVADESVVESILEHQDELKIYNSIHSRIIVQINDFLINEEDNRFCQIIIESNKKLYLLLTIDLVHSVFPNWGIWDKGALDDKCFIF